MHDFKYSVSIRGHTCTCLYVLGYFHLDGTNLQLQTHFVPKIRCHNLAVILRQFNYGNNSFIVLVLEPVP